MAHEYPKDRSVSRRPARERGRSGRGRAGAGRTASAAERAAGQDVGTLAGAEPSIIVVPFTNASDDDLGDLFVDGVSAEITSALSRARELVVIAHATAVAFRDRGATVEEIAARTGVQYVLSVALRRAGERIRINAELIEAGSGRCLWSGRHDGTREDIFALQDQVAERVIGALVPRIRWEEIARSRRKPPSNLAARDLVLQAYPYLWTHRKEDNDAALRLLERALELAPDYGRAAALAAWAHAQRIVYLWDPSDGDRQACRRFAEQAIANARDDPTALSAVAAALTLLDGPSTQARRFAERAIGLNPSNAWAWSRLGYVRLYAGEAEAAVEAFEKSMRLSPLDPMTFNNLMGIADAHFASGRYAEAVAWAERALAENPLMTWCHREVAVFKAKLGDVRGARESMARFIDSRPGVTIADVERNLAVLSPWYGPAYREGLHLAWPAEEEEETPSTATQRAPAPVEAEEGVFAREGAHWLVGFAGRFARLPDLKGLHDIRRLLERPGEEIHCLDLAERGDESYGGDDILDATARRSLKARVRALQEEVAEAEDLNDLGRAERLRAEMDQLVETLAKSLGLGGRGRRLGSLTERARTTVTWRIRHAVRKIEAAHEPLARHLANSLRTGTFCAYQPERPVAWRFGLARETEAP